MLGGGEFLPSNFIMDILADLVCDEGILQVFKILAKINQFQIGRI